MNQIHIQKESRKFLVWYVFSIMLLVIQISQYFICSGDNTLVIDIKTLNLISPFVPLEKFSLCPIFAIISSLLLIVSIGYRLLNKNKKKLLIIFEIGFVIAQLVLLLSISLYADGLTYFPNFPVIAVKGYAFAVGTILLTLLKNYIQYRINNKHR